VPRLVETEHRSDTLLRMLEVGLGGGISVGHLCLVTGARGMGALDMITNGGQYSWR
jgi:archaellum biogenesis ATPase FlaH